MKVINVNKRINNKGDIGLLNRNIGLGIGLGYKYWFLGLKLLLQITN